MENSGLTISQFAEGYTMYVSGYRDDLIELCVKIGKSISSIREKQMGWGSIIAVDSKKHQKLIKEILKK